jgi:PAS domain S-box-containing protein
MADETPEPSFADTSQARQNALLEFVVSQSSAIFYIADADGESPVRYISSNVETITGHAPQRFLEEANFGYRHIHPDDLTTYKRNITGLTAAGSVTHEYRFADADGTYRWFRDELRLVTEDGEAAEFVGCMIDVSAEKTSQEETRQSAEMFTSILDASPIPMSMVRFDDKKILFENPAIHAVFREDRDTAPPISGAYDIDPSERQRYFELLSQRGAVDNFVIRFRRDDGSEFVAAHSARLVEFDGEQVIVAGIVDLTEQSRRESELEMARHTLEDAIESLSEGFVLYDSDDRLVMCNSQYKEFHGDSADLLVPGAYWPDVTRERGRRGMFKEAATGLEEWLAGQLAVRGRAHRETFPFGDDRWYEYSHRRTRQGGFVSVWRDITARVEMEQNLRESEERIRHVLEACPMPVRMWNPDTGQVLYESPACSTMFGRDATKLAKADKRSMYVHAHDREAYLARVRKYGGVDNLELQLRHVNGTTFWASVSARLIEYLGEQVVVSSVVDLSDRKEMEEALRQSEEHFRSIVEGHPLPVWLVDLETARILYESPAAAEMVGRDWPSSEPAFTTDHVPDSAGRDELNAELRRSGSVLDAVFQLRRADGSLFWASINDRLISLRGREVSITSFVDLTERREAEAELVRQRERLHQNEKLSALGELLAGVAHELNNPLSILVGQAVMLQEKAESEEVASRAGRIATAGDRCARIVKTFLAMARQDPSDPSAVAIGDVIENALEVTAYSLRSSGIELTLDMSDDLPPVMADGDQLVQVFTNLIVNAEHAMHDLDGRRKLHISAAHRPETGFVAVTVRDNGGGVPEDVKSRIFEPLYTTKGIGAGTGMGLALCHRIIEGHGGSIELQSDNNAGATFVVCLPHAIVTSAALRPDSEVESPATRYSVLVVDDEADVGETIADVLEHVGHEVTVVGTGREALQQIGEQRFDVILSDVRMPELDGPALYRELQSIDPELPNSLAFITGDTLSPRVREFLDSSGRPYLEKPILPQDARDLVSRLMDTKKV